MLRFLVFDNGQPVRSLTLEGAYLVGTDQIPVRGEFELRNGQLYCHKRTQGPAALAMLWPVKGIGRILLETTRLIERERPYNLQPRTGPRPAHANRPQARRTGACSTSRTSRHIIRNCNRSLDLFIQALKTSDVAAASALAEQVLSMAAPLGEQMALFHASVFVNRRRQVGQYNRRIFGCHANPEIQSDLYRRKLINAFDFVSLPVSWKTIEPKQGEFRWEKAG